MIVHDLVWKKKDYLFLFLLTTFLTCSHVSESFIISLNWLRGQPVTASQSVHVQTGIRQTAERRVLTQTVRAQTSCWGGGTAAPA